MPAITADQPSRRSGNKDFARVLDWLQLAVAAPALFLCFRGRGRPFHWMLLPLALPALRFAVDPAFRVRVSEWLRELWEAVQLYARQGGKVPWRAVLALVVFPAGLLLLSSGRTMGSGDTWPVVPTACSLALDGDWDLDEFAAAAPAGYRGADGLPYCTLKLNGHVYSSYPAGMVQFALPVAWVAQLAGANLREGHVQ